MLEQIANAWKGGEEALLNLEKARKEEEEKLTMKEHEKQLSKMIDAFVLHFIG